MRILMEKKFSEKILSVSERKIIAEIESAMKKLEVNMEQSEGDKENNVFFVKRLVGMHMVLRIYKLKKNSFIINKVKSMDSEEIDQCFDLLRPGLKKEFQMLAVERRYEKSLEAFQKKFLEYIDESFEPKSLEICEKSALACEKIVLSTTGFYEFYSDARIKKILLRKLELAHIDNSLKSFITEIYNFLSLSQQFESIELENDFKEKFNQFYYSRKKQLEPGIINMVLLEIVKQADISRDFLLTYLENRSHQDVKTNVKIILDLVKQYEAYFKEYSEEKEQLNQKFHQESLAMDAQYSKRSFKENIILESLESYHILSDVKENPYFYLNSSNVELYLNYLFFSNQDSTFEGNMQKYAESFCDVAHPFYADLKDYIGKSCGCSFDHLSEKGYELILDELLKFQKINKLIKGANVFELTEMQVLTTNFNENPQLHLGL